MRGQIGVGVASCKTVFLLVTSYSLVQTLLLKDASFSHTVQFKMDGWTVSE